MDSQQKKVEISDIQVYWKFGTAAAVKDTQYTQQIDHINHKIGIVVQIRPIEP